MNDVQQKLLDEFCLKFGEHFDGFVLVTLVKTDDHHSDKHISYDGGFYTALGLIEQAKHDLMTRVRTVEGED
jgi:hypothetical protein